MRKLFSFLLTCVIVLNSNASLTALELQDMTAFDRALKAESSVLSFLSVAVVPLTLVDDLLKNTVPLLPSLKTSSSNQNKSNKKDARNTSSEFSLTCSYPAIETAGNGLYSSALLLSNMIFSDNGLNCFDRSRRLPAQNTFIYLFLLMYMVLLMKSNLPWAMIFSIRQITNPVVVKGRVFNLGSEL